MVATFVPAIRHVIRGYGGEFAAFAGKRAANLHECGAKITIEIETSP
jgi:hypothetical protein